MIKFSGYFKDGAILQRGESVTVNGRADGEVFCSLQGGDYNVAKTCQADAQGRFSVELPAVGDTKSEFVLTAECGGERVFAKIRFGDVYLTMGQSNMSYALSATEDYELWLDRAEKCEISVISIDESPVLNENGEYEILRPVFPLDDFAADYEWRRSRKDLEKTSAISVQTAVLLAEKRGVPIGVVHTSMGGLSVESYIPRQALEADPVLLEFTKRVGRYQTIEEYNHVGGRNFSQVAGVWNEKIAPLSGRKFSGFVWYLGESSVWDFEFAKMFLAEMKLVVKSLRGKFGTLPFVAVHIAPEYYAYGDSYGYEYINESLNFLGEETADTSVLPVYDIEPRWLKPNGDLYFHPIHPVNKAPISERVAAALDGGRFCYPRIAKIEYEGGRALCTVENAGEGLAGEEYFGFTLANENGKYYPASARRKGKDKIEVSSPDVKQATALTYAFMQYQDFCNVKTLDGAPLLPFRTNAEPVGRNYYFPPAFTVNGAQEVYENNFGWAIGTAHKVPVWKSGEIYACRAVEIGSGDNEMRFTAHPRAEDYSIFGFSPNFCLAGHKHHFADFRYLNFQLRAEGQGSVELLGVVVRRADGSIFRLALLNGAERAESLPVGEEYAAYCVSLEKGSSGDSSFCEFTETDRQNFVQAEFFFRAKQKTTVCLKNVCHSDENRSVRLCKEKIDNEMRTDIQLPESSDSMKNA